MSAFVNINPLKPIKYTTQTRRYSPKLGRNSVRCESSTEVTTEKRQIKVSNGNNSLEICRVLNGMWQTSGGWGRIDRNDAVQAMLRYTDAGLSTFDMADHCNFLFTFSTFCSLFIFAFTLRIFWT